MAQNLIRFPKIFIPTQTLTVVLFSEPDRFLAHPCVHCLDPRDGFVKNSTLPHHEHHAKFVRLLVHKHHPTVSITLVHELEGLPETPILKAASPCKRELTSRMDFVPPSCEDLALGAVPGHRRQRTGTTHLKEDEGQEEVLEDRDEEVKENEVEQKVKEVRENAQLMRHGDDHVME